MVSTFYRLLSKPMGAIVNTCTSIFNNFKKSAPSCIAEYFPSCEPKENLIEVNPQGVFHHTIAEEPKKHMVEVSPKGIFHRNTVEELKGLKPEQPKAPFSAKLPFQQENRYDKLRRHFKSDEVDFIYRRAFKSISPVDHITAKDNIFDAGVLVQPTASQSSNADSDLVTHELSESMVLVQCPTNQTTDENSDLSSSGVLIQPLPRLQSRPYFAVGPISLVRALLK